MKIDINSIEQAIESQPELFAEVHALKDVPQPPKWHPEGDSYVHTMLVLQHALNKHYPWVVVLSAVCHDLGKALTNKEKWPSHHGHATYGIEPTKVLLTRLNIDPEVIKRVQFITKYHMHIHDAFKLNSLTYVKIFKEAYELTGSATNAIVLLYNLILLGECDHYGRGNVDRTVAYANTDFMYRMFNQIWYSMLAHGTNWINIGKELGQFKSKIQENINVNH